MEQILLVVHAETDGTLARPGLEALAVSLRLMELCPGSSLSVGLVGVNVQSVADLLAASGASQFLSVSGPEFSNSRFSTDAIAVEALCRFVKPSLVVGPATSRWNRSMAAVAHRLGGRIDTHVTGVESNNGSLAVQRWLYRQRMQATVQRTKRPWFLLAETGILPPWNGAPGKAKVEAIAAPISAADLRTTVLEQRSSVTKFETIRPDAELLFVAGAGWTKKQADGAPHLDEAESSILQFLKSTGASLGSSKSLVDLSGEGQAVLSFLSHLNQIGQTGATPRHPKGLATCCHGEEPHSVGWRFVQERRAINLDPNCGWARGKADVLYVADAFAVLRELNKLLSSEKNG